MPNVWSGRPCIISTLIWAKPSSFAALMAVLACPALCTRPRRCRDESSKLCTPTDSRLTPASLKPAKRSTSKVPGLASRVTSISGKHTNCWRMPCNSCLMASAENKLGVPPPIKILCKGRSCAQTCSMAKSAKSFSIYACSGTDSAPTAWELKSQ